MSTISPFPSLTVAGPRGQNVAVSPSQTAEAAEIDANRDGVCSDDEIERYMRDQQILRPAPAEGNVGRITEEFKAHLTGQRVATASASGDDYRSLAELETRMHELASEHPDRCQLISIAKTHEGRDVYALKVSSDAQGDTSSKPGVVFTGAHHAREWMTPEVTLGMAEEMIAGYDTQADMKRRVDGAETWFIPVVNPDGFAYSQTRDNMWRKNRVPITDPKKPGGKPSAYGVDLNRNYYDGKPEHLPMYRTPGDSPDSTWDDFGASDNPRSDAFRGLGPATEAEVQGMIAFQNSRPNIHGVVDQHSYGGLLMRPWDHTADEPENLAAYDEAAARILAGQGDEPCRYIQTYDLYPTTGATTTFHQLSGRFAFGIEMGDSFQPPFSEFPSIYKSISGGNFAFLDWVMEKFPTPAPPPTPVPPAPEPPTPEPPTSVGGDGQTA